MGTWLYDQEFCQWNANNISEGLYLLVHLFVLHPLEIQLALGYLEYPENQEVLQVQAHHDHPTTNTIPILQSDISIRYIRSGHFQVNIFIKTKLRILFYYTTITELLLCTTAIYIYSWDGSAENHEIKPYLQNSPIRAEHV